MLFLLVSAVLAGQPIQVRATLSLGHSFLVEIRQLYHAPWIDSIRQNTLGGLVLRVSCYSFGIAMGIVAKSAIVAKMKDSTRGHPFAH